jgi:integrase
VLSYAVDRGWIEPSQFKVLRRPRAAALRRERGSRGSQWYSLDDIRRLLHAAKEDSPGMYVAVLCGVFLGYGARDLSGLRREHLDGDFLDYPRPKSGVARRGWCPVELSALIRHGNVLPLKTATGLPLVEGLRSGSYGSSWRDRLAQPFRELCEKAGVEPRGFYGLRRSFARLSQIAEDPLATGCVMGHLDGGQTAVYAGRPSDSRLRKLGVRLWNYVHGDHGDRERGEAEMEALESLGMRKAGTEDTGRP